MASNRNLEALKNCYFHWNESKGRNTDVWLEMMSDEVELLSLARGKDPSVSFTAPRSNKVEVRDYLAGLLDDWAMEHYTIDEYVADGDRICAIGSTAWKNKNTGIRVETPKVDFVKFSDGKIIAFHEFYDTAGLIAAACGKAEVKISA
jgi:ketosteroid isomerase-like protein